MSVLFVFDSLRWLWEVFDFDFFDLKVRVSFNALRFFLIRIELHLRGVSLFSMGLF